MLPPSPPRETSIPSIKSTLTPSKPLQTHIGDDCSIIWRWSKFCTLNQPYTTRICRIGWEISLSRWKRDTGAPDSVGIVAVLLLRFADPSRHLAPYFHIVHDKLLLIRSKKKTIYKHKYHDILAERVSVGADDCCCRSEWLELRLRYRRTTSPRG